MFGIILAARGSPSPCPRPRSRSTQPLLARGDDGPGRPRGTDRGIAPRLADRRRAVARAEELRFEVPKVQEGPHRACPPPPRRRPDLHRTSQLRRPECRRRDPRPSAGARNPRAGSDSGVPPRPCGFLSWDPDPVSRAGSPHVPRDELPEVPRLPDPRPHRSGFAGPGRPGRDRTTTGRGPEAEVPDRRDPPAAGRRGRQEVRQGRLRPTGTSQRRHLRPDASRGSVRLRPRQPIQHLCHLGGLQRVRAPRPEGKTPPPPVDRAVPGFPRGARFRERSVRDG